MILLYSQADKSKPSERVGRKASGPEAVIVQESGVAEAGASVPTPLNGVGFLLALTHIKLKRF